MAEGEEGAEPADVYSFGSLLLKLLAGGFWSLLHADTVTKQLQAGKYDWLDPFAEWPREHATELCQLALRYPPPRMSALCGFLGGPGQNFVHHPKTTTGCSFQTLSAKD